MFNNKKKEIYNPQLDINNANMVKQLLESEVWKNIIEPYFKKCKEELSNGMIWRGNTDSIEKVGIGCVYNSGKISMIEDFNRKLSIIIEKGIEAEKKLKKINTEE